MKVSHRSRDWEVGVQLAVVLRFQGFLSRPVQDVVSSATMKLTGQPQCIEVQFGIPVEGIAFGGTEHLESRRQGLRPGKAETLCTV